MGQELTMAEMCVFVSSVWKTLRRIVTPDEQKAAKAEVAAVNEMTKSPCWEKIECNVFENGYTDPTTMKPFLSTLCGQI